jgi:hypothetical protein
MQMSQTEATEDLSQAGKEESGQYPPSLDIIYVEIKERLDIQIKQVDALDGKTGTLLFISSIVIGIGAAAQAALIGSTDNPWVLLLFSVPIVFYLLTVLTALRSWIVRPYFRDPEPRPLRDVYLFEQQEFTKRRLIAQFISAYEWNAGVMKKKVNELRWSTWYFLAEIISITLVLLVRAWLA